MRNISFHLKVLALIGVAFSVLHCSKGSDSNDSGSSCPANYYGTAVGCLPACGPSMVSYNGQCMPTTSITSAMGNGGAVSCGVGRLQSQYGCLPQCGPSSVMYNNQCIPATGIGGQIPIGGSGYGGTNICSGRCGPGQTDMGNSCLPQYSCGPCYGYANGTCYIGINAYSYYGY